MSEKYAAKIAYQNIEVATKYEDIRFKNIRGKFGHWLDYKAIKKIITKLDIEGKTLDLACGTGRISRILAESGFNVYSSDVSFEMLYVGKTKQNNDFPILGFYQAAGEELPFRDKTFDLICTARFIGHLPQNIRSEVLKEIARIGKRNVIIEISLFSLFAEIRHNLRWKLQAIFGKKIIEGTWKWNVFRKKEIEKEFINAGLIPIMKIPKFPLLSDGWYYLLQTENKYNLNKENSLMQSNDFNEILCCPKCKGILISENNNQQLTCKKCDLKFEVKNGIYKMLIE